MHIHIPLVDLADCDLASLFVDNRPVLSINATKTIDDLYFVERTPSHMMQGNKTNCPPYLVRRKLISISINEFLAEPYTYLLVRSMP